MRGALLAGLVGGAAGAAWAQAFDSDEIQREARRAAAEARLEAACVSAYPPAFDADGSGYSFADCRCAADALIREAGADALGGIGGKEAAARLQPHLDSCRAGGGAKPSDLAMPPVVAAPPVGSAGPATDGTEAPVQEVTARVEIVPESERSGGLLAWLGRSGLPLWIWVLLPVAAGVAALVLMARRGKTR
ncbi:hypothetical protein [Sphingosinicella terrae]|uniref:hypothetical protein n=1 Tax=Sphingosinicella terrae TaxID=2172047 RepID=UPI000E0E03A5|nr:hypothetical protein [Sphingosinicella terrae]